MLAPSTSTNRTGQILGKPSIWSDAMLELIDVQPLHGGRRVLAFGNGCVVVQSVRPGLEETRWEFKIARQRALDLFQLCVENDLATIETEQRLGLPDEARILLRLVGAERIDRRVYQWSGVTDARFDAIYRSIRSLEDLTTGETPSYTGRYQDYYYPRDRWRELRWRVRDWYRQIDIDPLRLLAFLIPMLLLFVIAYFWVRIDPLVTYGFGGGVAQGYVWLHNWVISWFDGRAVWAPTNSGLWYVAGFSIGVLLPFAIDFLFRLLLRLISQR